MTQPPFADTPQDSVLVKPYFIRQQPLLPTACESPGPRAAFLGSGIAHTKAGSEMFKGFLKGLLAAAAIIAVAAILVLAGPITIGFSTIAMSLATISFFAGTAAAVTGVIAAATKRGKATGAKAVGPITGSVLKGEVKVRFNGKPAANVGQEIGCKDHQTPQKIAAGAATVRINGRLAAREGDKTTCGSVITEPVEPNICIGTKASEVKLDVKPEVPEWADRSVAGLETASKWLGYTALATGVGAAGLYSAASAGVTSWAGVNLSTSLAIGRGMFGKLAIGGSVMLGTNYAKEEGAPIIGDWAYENAKAEGLSDYEASLRRDNAMLRTETAIEIVPMLGDKYLDKASEWVGGYSSSSPDGITPAGRSPTPDSPSSGPSPSPTPDGPSNTPPSPSPDGPSQPSAGSSPDATLGSNAPRNGSPPTPDTATPPSRPNDDFLQGATNRADAHARAQVDADGKPLSPGKRRAASEAEFKRILDTEGAGRGIETNVRFNPDGSRWKPGQPTKGTRVVDAVEGLGGPNPRVIDSSFGKASMPKSRADELGARAGSPDAPAEVTQFKPNVPFRIYN